MKNDINDNVFEYEEIGSRIKKYRKENKITQVKLAEMINKSESSIQKYEKGTVEIPNSVLQDISNALGVTIYDLVGIEKDTITDFIGAAKNFYLNNFAIDIDNEEDREKVLINNILSELDKLNLEGKKEILKRTKELTQLEQYKEE